MIHRHGHWCAHGHPWGQGYDPGMIASTHGPGMLVSTLSTVLWIVLFIGLAWALLRWIGPYIMPIIADIFDLEPADPPALEILRQRYAAGEIDAVTFEQMRERLEASYQQGEHRHPS